MASWPTATPNAKSAGRPESWNAESAHRLPAASISQPVRYSGKRTSAISPATSHDVPAKNAIVMTTGDSDVSLVPVTTSAAA